MLKLISEHVETKAWILKTAARKKKEKKDYRLM